jgi:hypothetical protein
VLIASIQLQVRAVEETPPGPPPRAAVRCVRRTGGPVPARPGRHLPRLGGDHHRRQPMSRAAARVAGGVSGIALVTQRLRPSSPAPTGPLAWRSTPGGHPLADAVARGARARLGRAQWAEGQPLPIGSTSSPDVLCGWRPSPCGMFCAPHGARQTPSRPNQLDLGKRGRSALGIVRSGLPISGVPSAIKATTCRNVSGSEMVFGS